MNKTRVVHVINVDVGVRIHLKNQLLFLQAKGYDVSAICSPGPMVPESGITPEGIPVHTIPMSRDISPLQDLRLMWRLFQLFRQESYDIVHTHSVKPGLIGRLAAKMARIPHIVHTVHGLLLYDGMPCSTYWLWRIGEAVGAWVGDYALCQSHQDMKILLAKGIYRRGTISYLGNGITLKNFDPAQLSHEKLVQLRRGFGITPNQKVIATVGRLTSDKGYFEFAEMARMVHRENPNTRFWIIGRSETDKGNGLNIDDIITGDMHDYVTYLGMRDDMPYIFAAMDIFVFPSHHEGFPRALMEASAMGKPIVATDVRGCREAVIHNKTGLLVRPFDPSALASAVKSLLSNEEQADKLGKAARACALNRFDEREYFARIKQTYDTLLAKKASNSL